MDAILSNRGIQTPPEFTAPLRRAWAAPEDAVAICREILKFLGTLALIMVTALIMLMAG